MTVARRRREHLRCDACGWTGITGQGRIRLAIYVGSLLAVAVSIALELAGVLALGDSVWAWSITLLLASIGLRLLVRGDRCGSCDTALGYGKLR